MSGEELESEFVPEEEAEQGPALIKKLRERLKKATEEKQEYLEGWQRARADFTNFRREEATAADERSRQATAEVVTLLLPTLDTLEMALKHAQSKEMNLVHKQLLDALRGMDVEFYGKVGDAFDPYRYEALREVVVDSKEQDHKVVSVERSGYAIKSAGEKGEKIIRPAQVTVGALREANKSNLQE